MFIIFGNKVLLSQKYKIYFFKLVKISKVLGASDFVSLDFFFFDNFFLITV